ncbi:MAG: metallophosphoesterase family protein [Verrucomicrobiota bacterium]
MKIAILSDVHDRLDHLASVLVQVRKLNCQRLFFLGDFCAPFSLKALAEGFDGPIEAIFGNNDGDEFLLCQIATGYEHVSLHGHYAELEVGSRKAALYHYPEVALRLAQSGPLDAVFSGHDHQRYQKRLGQTLWANPGEVMGRFGVVSFGIWESEENAFEHVMISIGEE